MINPFFENKGPFEIKKLLKLSDVKNIKNYKNFKVYNISDLFSANKNDITFFHSKKYENLASKTKASFCVTTNYLSKFLPEKCNKILVHNVLISVANITKLFYPKLNHLLYLWQ